MTDFIKIDDFVNERKLSALALDKECKKLIDFAKKDEINSRSFVGNNLIYCYKKITEEQKINEFNKLMKNAIDNAFANMKNINKDELINITKEYIENNM